LNFFARGTFSPLINLSAPTFFPLLGHPTFLEHEVAKKDIINRTDTDFKKKYFM
jgi:hypothetical protein